MKNLSDAYTGLVTGLIIGLLMGLMAPPYFLKDTLGFRKHIFKVGDCISNGLFVERILEIRARVYITESNLSGKWRKLPSSTPIWLIDEDYPRVNCETRAMIK